LHAFVSEFFDVILWRIAPIFGVVNAQKRI